MQQEITRTSEKEYAQLKQLVREKGLLDRQPRYYWFKIPFTLAWLALSFALLFVINNPWLVLLDAVFLGFAFVQGAEIGHDMCHQQVTHSRWKNLVLVTIFTNFVLGSSRDWWNRKHNAHHGNPNQLDMDPDIDIPLVAFTKDQARSKRGIARFVTKYQAFLLLPLTTLQAVAIYWDSINFIVRRQSKHNLWEGSLFVLHFVWFFAVIFYALGPWMGLAFIGVELAVSGVHLALIFAPNHKGMAILEANTHQDFLRRQVLTARNLIPNPVMDFFYGGLNYQIEHHLFPDMPRNNLSKARVVVKAFCAEHGIPYYETGFIQSWREIFSYLHQVGAPLREKHPPELERGAVS